MALTNEQRRAGAIAHINKLCGTEFIDGTDLPADIEMAIESLLKAVNESNVASQRLGDMSKSFFQGQTYKSAVDYLKPYKKARYF